jgi:hypothetical protein
MEAEEGIKKKRCKIISSKGLLHGKLVENLLRAEEVGMSKNVEIIGLRNLKPDPQNTRKHTSRNVAMVVDALQEVGAARSIVIERKRCRSSWERHD